jgi:hypothetical protein
VPLVHREFQGDDVIEGGQGDDVIEGGRGRNRIKGQAGDDRIDGGPEPSIVDGGPGADACRAVETVKNCEEALDGGL